MIVTPTMIADATCAAAARGLPGIPPDIVEAMLRAAVDPPEVDELPPVPVGVPTIAWDETVWRGDTAGVEVTRGSPQDSDLMAAMREGRVIRVAQGKGKRAKVTFWKATRRTVKRTAAMFELERAI